MRMAKTPWPLLSKYLPNSVDRAFATSAATLTISFALLVGGTVMMLTSGGRPATPSAPVAYTVPVSTWATPIPLVSAIPPREPMQVEPRNGEEAVPSAPRSEPPADLRLEERYPSTLEVLSDSPAVVWLGSQRIGIAPGTFTPIRPGSYVLKLEGGDGNILQKHVIVTPGSTTYVRAGSLDRAPRTAERLAPAGGNP